MSFVFVTGGLALAFFAAILKALAVDQVRGQIQQRITADVEATIASLPDALKDEWADEWRGDLADVISMPFTAVLFARGLRLSAIELVNEASPDASITLPERRPRKLSLRASGRLFAARFQLFFDRRRPWLVRGSAVYSAHIIARLYVKLEHYEQIHKRSANHRRPIAPSYPTSRGHTPNPARRRAESSQQRQLSREPVTLMRGRDGSWWRAG